MKKVLLFFAFLNSLYAFCQLPQTRFELSNGKETSTYYEIIDWWHAADSLSSKINMLTMGPTDAGLPLHLLVISNNGISDFKRIQEENKLIILINNGIHPGEPDGIDASMLLAKAIIQNKLKLPDNVVLAIIPVYNIGGCLNRSKYHRVDQNGPEAFGFRGNSQNFDLNRDFIKADSKEAISFAQIFHLTDPDILIDNHVSDGADYQHVMTLLTSQYNKLGGVMGDFLHEKMESGIYELMKQKGYDLVPYVNFEGSGKVENGWPAYWDSPRYSTGYATLWGTFSFMPETHMLKPYNQRVQSTLALMESFIEFAASNHDIIKKLRAQTKQDVQNQENFAVHWNLDSSKTSQITYKGFESYIKNSTVSGLPALFYNRDKPYTKQIPFYNFYAADKFVKKPTAYIIPQGWWKVIERLQENKVHMMRFESDTICNVEVYKIENYTSNPKQFEGHHLNYDVETSTTTQQMHFRKGDWYIPMNQEANRFLIETLEPVCQDSYFAWNFFDAILGKKEVYSAYDFENIASDYLSKHPELKAKLNEKRATDTAFAKSASAQLNFVYQNSPWLEPDYLRYPVYRIPQ